jgi:RNA polymerase sigma-70 factor, ECF subfamily
LQTQLEINDTHIITEIKKGNASVFKDVYRIYYSPLCRFANKYFEDKEEAEDIVQETMVKMWEQRNRLEINTLKTYLYSAVKNSCLNRLKHLIVVQKHNETAAIEIKMIELEHDDDFQDEEKKILERKVFEAIDELPEQCGKIVKMKYIDGMKSKDIAILTNLSPRTIETHLYKGLKTLSQKLKNAVPTLLCLILFFLTKLYVH